MAYFEVNLTLVSEDTWWIDSCPTTHIGVSIYDSLNCQKTYIYVANGKKVEVEVIGKFKLLLETEFYLFLNEIFIVLFFRRNLISISTLDKFGFTY